MTPQQEFNWKSLLNISDSWFKSVSTNDKAAFPDLLRFYLRAFRESPLGDGYEDPDAKVIPILARVIDSIISHKVDISEANIKNIISVADTNAYIDYARQDPERSLHLGCFLMYAAGKPKLDIKIRTAIPTIAELLTSKPLTSKEDNLKVTLAEHFFGMPWVVLYQSELNEDGHAATEVALNTAAGFKNISQQANDGTGHNSLPNDLALS